MKRENTGYLLLLICLVISVGGLFYMPPIQQDLSYHLFSDNSTLFNIQNYWNVVSNIPYLIVGLIAISKPPELSSMSTKYAYFIFFIGVALVSFGSAYYHLNPSNETLIWDRLPMTVAFMSLISVIVSDYIDAKMGRQMLVPLLLLGVLSIGYWILFDDLRLYALIQFYPMIAIVIILICFKSKYDQVSGYWMLLIAYIIAKFFEHYDQEIHHVIGVLSGHTLKHIISAIGVIALYRAYKIRKPI